MLGFVVLTAGTAVFVAAEFSLTALERSTVDANARTGGPRDKMVQRAHRSLSFQLSGAQVGISLTTLITGYLAEPLIARLLEPLFHAMAMPEAWAHGLALALSLIIATSISMIFGELVAQYLAVAHPLATARVVAGPQVLFSMLFTPVIRLTNGTANWILRRLGIEPAEELRSARSPQELGSLVRNSARRGSLEPVTAALVDRSLQFGARTAEELMTPRSKIEALAGRRHRRRPGGQGDRDRLFAVPDRGAATSTRPSAWCMSSRCSRYRRTNVSARGWPIWRCPSPTVPSTLDGDAVMAQTRANGCRQRWSSTSTAALPAWSPWRT